MFGFGFMKKRQEKPSEKAAVVDLSDHLINWGFTPDQAIRTAEKFWKANNEKLKSVV